MDQPVDDLQFVGGESDEELKSSLMQDRYNEVKHICEVLCVSVDDYDPQNTVELICKYQPKGTRLIYSAITKYVYDLPEDKLGNFSVNLETLAQYAENESGVSLEIREAVVRIWDHFHLAQRQVANVRDVIANAVTDSREELKEDLYRDLHEKLHEEFDGMAKKLYTTLHKNLHEEFDGMAKKLYTTLHKNLHKEFDGMAKDYTTILGIFSSIVIAFVAGLVFSSSVLEHMSDVTIYRLGFVILLLGFMMLNIIDLLVRYIFNLNHANKDDKSVRVQEEKPAGFMKRWKCFIRSHKERTEEIRFPIAKFNWILLILALVLLVAWLTQFNDFPYWLQENFLPWK